MVSMKKVYMMSAIFILALAGCGSSPSVPSQATAVSSIQDELDIAIRDASDYLSNNIPKGSKIVILNVQSDSEALSEYIIDELIANAVNDKLFSVVDRQQLDLIRQEQNFQFSGEVDDDFALDVGRFFGAQTIVSGRMNPLGDRYRLIVRALNVQTAEVQGQYNRNLATGPTITALINIRSNSTTASENRATQPVTPPVNEQTSPTTTSAPVVTSAPPAATSTPSTAASISSGTTPAPAASTSTVTPSAAEQSTSSQDQNRPGLYVNNTYQGQMDLMDAIDWIALNVRSDSNYVIVLGKDEAASNISLSYNNLRVNVTLKGSGTERRVSYDVQRPSYSLITIGPGVTFTMEEGVAFIGLQNEYNSKSMVRVEGGIFIMNGGTISGNAVRVERGGGVFVDSGTFTMNNGIISGNISTNSGGGVYIRQGTFTMNNGTISGNSASDGGGVYIGGGSEGGFFTMNGGSIKGNSAHNGGGVFISSGGSFVKSGSGGIIYGSNAPEGDANRKSPSGDGVAVLCMYIHGRRQRDTTARVSQAMDSRQSGAAGGWE